MHTRQDRQGGYLYEIPLFLLLLVLVAALVVPRLSPPARTAAIALVGVLALGGLLRLLSGSGTIVGGAGGLSHRRRVGILVLAVAVLAAAAVAALVTVIGRGA